jgi:hypothetical protein
LELFTGRNHKTAEVYMTKINDIKGHAFDDLDRIYPMAQGHAFGDLDWFYIMAQDSILTNIPMSKIYRVFIFRCAQL